MGRATLTADAIGNDGDRAGDPAYTGSHAREQANPQGEASPGSHEADRHRLRDHAVQASLGSCNDAIISPTLRSARYEPRRADTTLDQRAVMNDVIEGLQTANLVIADLTGRNANVFYELGIAHVLQKPVIILAQDKEDIPFDLSAYRTLIYSIGLAAKPTLRIEEDLSGPLRLLLDATARGEVTFRNPFTDFASAGPEAPATPAAEETEGVLDTLLRLQEDTPKFEAVTNRLNEVIESLGKKQGDLNPEVAEAAQKQDIKGALLIMKRVPAMWSEHADRLQPIIDDELLPLTISLETGLLGEVRAALLADDAERQKKALETVKTLRDSSTQAGASAAELAATIRKNSNWSSVLMAPGNRLASTLERTVMAIQTVAELPSAAQQLIDQTKRS